MKKMMAITFGVVVMSGSLSACKAHHKIDVVDIQTTYKNSIQYRALCSEQPGAPKDTSHKRCSWVMDALASGRLCGFGQERLRRFGKAMDEFGDSTAQKTAWHSATTDDERVAIYLGLVSGAFYVEGDDCQSCPGMAADAERREVAALETEGEPVGNCDY